MEPAVKQLMRSQTDRVFGGVCGGLAEYLGWDAVLVRVAYVVLTLLSLGIGGVVLYLFAWMLIPPAPPGLVPATSRVRPSTRVVLGIFLAVAGVLALAGSFLPPFVAWPDVRIAGAIVLLLLGLALILWNRTAAVLRPPVETEAGSAPPVALPPATRPRLVRRRRGRKLAGISVGLGEYFDVDPTIIRLLWLVLFFFWGIGLLLYLVLWVVMPLED